MKVFFTTRAVINYNSTLDYIKKEWGEKVALAFEQKAIDFIDLLTKFPEIGSVENDKQIRGFQLTRHTKIFYRIKDKKIILLSFFESRQNPEKKPK